MTTTGQRCSMPDCSGTDFARGWCAKHYAQWRRKRPGHCRYCGGELGVEVHNGKTHDRCRQGRREAWAKLTNRILVAYGARCACCGEVEPKFLTIDHVDGGGAAHRKRLGSGNRRVMLDIINRGFPPEFQILCFNCNCGRARNAGICPHVVAAVAA